MRVAQRIGNCHAVARLNRNRPNARWGMRPIRPRSERRLPPPPYARGADRVFSAVPIEFHWFCRVRASFGCANLDGSNQVIYSTYGFALFGPEAAILLLPYLFGRQLASNH